MKLLGTLALLLVSVLPASAQQLAVRLVPPVPPATVPAVQLTWNASTLPAGAPAVTGYNVLRGTAAGGETALANPGLVLTYTDSTVVAGTTYYYTVTATNSAATSGPSNEASILVPNNVAPNPPTGLAATVIQVAQSQFKVKLNWLASTTPGVFMYDVYRGGTLRGTSTGLSYTDTGTFTPGKTYSYSVAAVEAVTTADSAQSAGASVRIP